MVCVCMCARACPPTSIARCTYARYAVISHLVHIGAWHRTYLHPNLSTRLVKRQLCRRMKRAIAFMHTARRASVFRKCMVHAVLLALGRTMFDQGNGHIQRTKTFSTATRFLSCWTIYRRWCDRRHRVLMTYTNRKRCRCRHTLTSCLHQWQKCLFFLF